MLTEQRIALARSVCARIMALADDGDEVQVIDGELMRLELGRQRYGALDLRKDHRDWNREGDEEIADWAVYRALKRTSARQRAVDAVEAGFDELKTATTDRSLKEALVEWKCSGCGGPWKNGCSACGGMAFYAR